MARGETFAGGDKATTQLPEVLSARLLPPAFPPTFATTFPFLASSNTLSISSLAFLTRLWYAAGVSISATNRSRSVGSPRALATASRMSR
jgi:hypothetical protein